MRVLVTGATGFVGTHLVRALVKAGHDVRALSRTASRDSVPSGAEPVAGDVTEPSSLRSALAGVDAVVHLVAIIAERGGRTYYGVNHLGTENVVRAMKEAGVSTLVHQSALGVGPDERFPYLHSKWLGEEAVRASGLDYTILRPGVIHGRGAGFFKPIVWNVRWLPVFPLPAGGRTRFQPIHVADVCTAMEMSLRAPRRDTVEIGGLEVLTFAQIVEVVMEALAKRRRTVSVPVAAARPFAWTQRLRAQPLVTSDQLDMVVLDNTTALDSVERAFGFAPVRFGESDLRWLSEL
jgi:NADH dehydrogenase